MQYILKHKDIDVLEFEIQKKFKNQVQFKFEDHLKDFYEIKNLKILNAQFLPASIASKFDLSSTHSQKNQLLLLNWLDNRQMPKERAHSKKLREMYNFDALKFLNASLGLSLMDVNWVIEKDRYEANKVEYTYDKINLYDNPEYSEKEMQLSLFGSYDEKRSFLSEYEKAKFEQAQKRQATSTLERSTYEQCTAKSREKKI